MMYARARRYEPRRRVVDFAAGGLPGDLLLTRDIAFVDFAGCLATTAYFATPTFLPRSADVLGIAGFVLTADVLGAAGFALTADVLGAAGFVLTADLLGGAVFVRTADLLDAAVFCDAARFPAFATGRTVAGPFSAGVRDGRFELFATFELPVLFADSTASSPAISIPNSAERSSDRRTRPGVLEAAARSAACAAWGKRSCASTPRSEKSSSGRESRRAPTP